MKTQLLSVFLLMFLSILGAMVAMGGTDLLGDIAGNETDATGIHYGQLFISPAIGIKEGYSDNIYAAPNEAVDDSYSVVLPRFKMAALLPNSKWGMELAGEYGRYNKYSDENYADQSLQMVAQYNMGEKNSLQSQMAWHIAHESRTDIEADKAIHPTEYELFTAKLRYLFSGRRIPIATEFEINKWNYFNTISDGVLIDNNDRDMFDSGIVFSAGYKPTPAYGIYVKNTYSQSHYALRVDDYGYKRSFNSNDLAVGVATEPESGIYSGSVFCGYITRKFADDRFPSAGRLTISGKLNWEIRRLTRVVFNADRFLDVTAFEAASSIRRDLAGAGLDHMLWNSMLLHASYNFGNDSYLGINRSETWDQVKASASYAVSRRVKMLAEISHETRSVNGISAPAGYTINVYSLQLQITI